MLYELSTLTQENCESVGNIMYILTNILKDSSKSSLNIPSYNLKYGIYVGFKYLLILEVLTNVFK